MRKLLVSGFVLSSYAAYALHEQFAAPANTNALPSALPTNASQTDPLGVQSDAAGTTSAQAPTAPTADQTAQGAVSAQPAKAAAPVPTATVASALGTYKDGTYTGYQANAFYGTVQVKVVIKGGKITSVQFVNYPQDRRTSQRINAVATQYLQSEAIQAQGANVDIVSGATLTSEAFMASLQSALDSAHN
jgi:uncharacterized protein with FMN-binding domain